jgi:hypothetical protein
MNSRRSRSAPARAVPGASPPPLSRNEQLRLELPATVDLLHKLRADLIPEQAIEAYVALHWLEWNGGSLRLTATGENVCAQIRARAV